MERNAIEMDKIHDDMDKKIPSGDAINDGMIDELHMLLPKAENYDGDFLRSHIYLPVPAYYLPLTICKIAAYLGGESDFSAEEHRSSFSLCLP